MRIITVCWLAALATLLGTATATATPAFAAGNATPPAAHEFLDVSCVSGENCLAIGEDLNAFHGRGGPLAESWNGKAWRIVAVRLPAGATAGVLGRVSCPSATHCVAVGDYRKGLTQHPLIDTWNGKAWTPVVPAAPAGVNTLLTGVSCVSAKNCVAVGAHTATQDFLPLSEIWSGRRWREVRPPTPGGTQLAALAGVSCVSASSCVAVGLDNISAGINALAESWNGRKWSLSRAVTPARGDTTVLESVSCGSAKSCLAVGYTQSAKGFRSLAEAWNGRTWTLAAVRWPTGTTSSQLTGVSCPTANRCVAVGILNSTLGGANTGRAAAVTWNGKGLAATSVPAPARGKVSLFNGVDCLSATACVAVGQAGPAKSVKGAGLSGFWNGKRWRLVGTR